MSPLIRFVMFVAVVGLALAIVIPNYLKSRQVRSLNECIDFNLPALAKAKKSWALEHGKKERDTPTDRELLPYLENHRWPVCHAGGNYTVGPVGMHPICSLEAHPWNPDPLPDKLLRR